MVSFKEGKVSEILNRRKGLTKVKVKVDGKTADALNYDYLTGEVSVEDRVILNTVAVDLNLGTGGKHFILWNLSRSNFSSPPNGHIMKLRYTPLQMSFLSVEENDLYRRQLQENLSLEGLPVIIGTLHSQLAPVAVTLKEVNKDLKLAYIMTDAGALPLALSDLVAELKSAKLLDTTITVGQSYGGDFEAINIFSALVAAKKVAQAGVVVVIMGPGVVGTDSFLGFSGIEQGEIINAVSVLGGKPIAIPRLSFKDKRKRHFGISHHTLTALSLAALASATVTVPKMPEDMMKLVLKELEESGASSKHEVKIVDNEITLRALKKHKIKVTTMGRTPAEEPEFFKAAGSAALYALELLK